MTRRSLPAMLLAALLLTTGTVACDDDGSIPESADKRLEASTQKLPADAQMAFIFSDLGAFRESASETQSLIDRIYAVDKLVKPQMGVGFARDVMGDASLEETLEASFWKNRGIDPDGAFTMATADYNLIIHTYVKDEEKFEKRLGDDGANDPESIDVAGTSAKKLSSDDGTIVWTIDGKLATVVYPAEGITPPETESPPTRKTLKEILELEPKDSLKESSAFQKFKKAAGGGPTLPYLNLDPILGSDYSTSGSPQVRRMVERLQEAVDGGGIVVSQEGRSLDARLWVGLTDVGKEQFDTLFNASTRAKWTKFATRNTLFGLRLDIDWNAIWSAFEASRSKKQKAMLDKQFETAQKTSGINLREDVFANLDGQAGFFVYGIGGEATAEVLRGIGAILGKVRALFAMKFGSAEALEKVAKKVAELDEKHITLRPLKPGDEDEKVESIRVLEMTIPPGGVAELFSGDSEGSDEDAQKGAASSEEEEASPSPAPVRAYIHENTLVVAATTVTERTVQKMLTGQSESSIESEADLNLGANFATTDALTGAYMNVRRFRNIFAKILNNIGGLYPAVKQVATTVEESMLSTTPRKSGFFLDLEVDAEPPTKGSSTGGE